jgi:phosphoribosylglycinamide formyltransferase 2
MHIATLMLLGSGELGREFAIAAKRLGCRIIACDRYANAPAMQVGDASEVFSMLDGAALRAAVEKHRPDVIVPEIEAIDTSTLAAAGARGVANRTVGQGRPADDEPRWHSRFRCRGAGLDDVEIPLRREPRRGDRGRRPGRSAVRGQAGDVELRQGPEHRGERESRVGSAWDYAVANMRGDRPRVIVEEFIRFDSEITLLTVATVTESCSARRSVTGRKKAIIAKAGSRRQFRKQRSPRRRTGGRTVVEALGGHGLFGVEFFIRGEKRSFPSSARGRTTPAWSP